MQIIPTSIPDVIEILPRVFNRRARILLRELERRTPSRTPASTDAFVQDNHSRSLRNVLRGLHYQIHQAQGKLVRVAGGRGLRRLGRPALRLADVRQVGFDRAVGGAQQHAVAAAWLRGTVSACCPDTPTWPTRPPTTTRPSTNAPCSGTTRNWPSLADPGRADRVAQGRRRNPFSEAEFYP